MHVTLTALLGSLGQQPIKDMTSLGTDFERHANWQGYAEEHPRPVNVVMHLLGDGDLNEGHRQVKAPAAKEFVARVTHTITSGKVQGNYWNRIKCKEHCGNSPEAVKGQAIINLYSQAWKILEDSLPEMYCVDLTEAYVMQDGASLRIIVRRNCMIHDCPTDNCIRNFWQKAEIRNKPSTESTTRVPQMSCFEKAVQCVPETWGCYYLGVPKV